MQLIELQLKENNAEDPSLIKIWNGSFKQPSIIQ